MGYISKQINFGGRTIINENINTTMYNYSFATNGYMSWKKGENQTNAL